MLERAVLEKSFTKTGLALDRLAEALNSTHTAPDILRDATIQRFEFTLELMWKLFRKVHLLRNVTVRRPFESILEAGAAGWLQHREMWEQMLQDRNLTSHTYEEKDAEAVYQRIREQYYPELRRAYDYVKHHYLDHHPWESWKESE